MPGEAHMKNNNLNTTLLLMDGKTLLELQSYHFKLANSKAATKKITPKHRSAYGVASSKKLIQRPNSSKKKKMLQRLLVSSSSMLEGRN